MNGPLSERGSSGDLAAWIDPARTALLVVDMQVDFAAPDGALGLAGVDLSAVPAALSTAEGLVAAARAAGAGVVFVGLKTQVELDSPSWRERLIRRGHDADRDLGVCRAGARGSDFFGPQPIDGDLVIEKLRYSAFNGDRLDAELTRRGVDTLVVCGMTTDCCIESTVRHAFHLDYHVFVVADACAAYEADLHEASLKSLDHNCAIVVDSDQVKAAWGEVGR